MAATAAGKAAAVQAKAAAKAAKAVAKAMARNHKGTAAVKRRRNLAEDSSESDMDDELSTTVEKSKPTSKPNKKKKKVESSDEEDEESEEEESEEDEETGEGKSASVDKNDDDDDKVWDVTDFTDLIGTTHYDSDDNAVYKCTSVAEYGSDIVVRRCRLLPSGKWGKELKAIDQSVLGRDMRLLNNASNNVDGKYRAIMATRLEKILD